MSMDLSEHSVVWWARRACSRPRKIVTAPKRPVRKLYRGYSSGPYRWVSPIMDADAKRRIYLRQRWDGNQFYVRPDLRGTPMQLRDNNIVPLTISGEAI